MLIKTGNHRQKSTFVAIPLETDGRTEVWSCFDSKNKDYKDNKDLCGFEHFLRLPRYLS